MKIARRILFLLLFLLFLCGPAQIQALAAAPASKIIQAGDAVLVDVTCRLATGEVVFTTDAELAEDPAVRRAAVFVPLEAYAPLKLIAGSPPHRTKDVVDKGFKGALMDKLALAVVAMHPQGRRKILIKAGADLSLTPKDRYLQRSNFLRRTVEVRVPANVFETRVGRAPAVGASFVPEPPLRFEVVAIEGETVVCRLVSPEGTRVETPFGPGRLRYLDEDESEYKVDLAVREGHLVRTRHLMGRISAVGERTFTIDYGHPFGGQPLYCELELRLAGA